MKFAGIVDSQNRLDRECYRSHRGWLDRGKVGEGRLSLHSYPIGALEAEALRLEGAEFVGCALSGSNFSFAILDDAIFNLCDLTTSSFRHGRLRRTMFESCNASKVDFRLNNFEGGHFLKCICIGASAERSIFKGVTLEKTSFEGAVFRDVVFDGATIRECDFRGVNFSRVKMNLDLARVRDTVFEDCDLRGANLEGLRLAETRFVRCRVHGITGKPDVQGNVVLEDADDSEAGDGSVSITQAKLLARWT